MFWVVGIGASAGGLEALSQFVQNLPAQFPGSIVIAQHLAPKAKSLMVDLLSRQASIPVVAAQNGKEIESGRIYVAPPNFDIEILENKICLTEAGPETRPKPSVDSFFSSLARCYGSRAIGIILSGTGTDGSEGVRAIHAAGGITIAQDGRSAKYDGMPVSAVQTGTVDSILSPDAIARGLQEIINTREAKRDAEVFPDSELLAVLRFLRDKHGRDFTEYKLSTIRRRLARRMQTLRCQTIQEYLGLLAKSHGEMAQLSQELLVSVSTFFRDPEVWDVVKTDLTEMYLKKEPGSDLRVWVAGCATGEEAYTIAIILAELEEKHARRIPIKVFATDLDHDAILEARNAVYDENDIRNVSPAYRMRFFHARAGNRFEVTKAIRELVVFARQDLVQNPPFVKLDMVTCRNVLIYFEPSLQKKVIETFHYALRPSGRLLLGKSESPIGNMQLFEWIDRKAKFFEKINVPSNLMHTSKLQTAPHMALSALVSKQEFKNAIPEKAYAKLIESYNLSGAIIDREGHIVHVLGDLSQFVKLSSGNADFRIQSLVPQALGLEIPILLSKVSKDFEVHRSRTHSMGQGKKATRYRLAMRPLSDNNVETGTRGLFLINFEVRHDEKVAPAPGTHSNSDLPVRFSELESELQQTKEHLQTLIEELGVSNEELQSLNEELSSTNEELQASNEELETSNEELQSSNEELTTVNEELAVKSMELRQTNAELINIYSSIGSPLIVVDAHLRVIKYNDEALKIFNLGPQMVGTDITRISANCELSDFRETLLGAVNSGIRSERVCESATVIYQMRILPFFDDTKKIIGAIITFFDNTLAIRAQKALEASENRVSSIINSSASLISLKDSQGRYILVNQKFAEFFGFTPEQLLGKTDREILPDSIAAQIREHDLEVLLKSVPVELQENYVGVDENHHSFLVNRFPIVSPGKTEPYAVGTIAIDNTAQVDAQNALRTSEARYRAIVEDQAVFVCRHRRSGELTYSNSAFASYFQVSSKQPIKFSDLVDPIDKTVVASALRSISARQPIAQYDHRYTDQSGQIRWIRWIHRGIFNSSEEATEFQAVGFDVTDSKKQTAHLIEQEAVFKSLFSNTSDFIVVFRVIDKDLVVEFLNSSAEKSYGPTITQLVGRRLEEFIDDSHKNEVLYRYRLAVESGIAQVVDEELNFLGSRRQLLTTIVPIPGPSGVIERVAAISRDVSSYKAIEQDLRTAKESSDVANKAKSDFLASMSHELRTPLNVVLGMAHLLSESPLEKEQKEFVASIGRSGQLLLSLIEDVLDISKIESGKIRLSVEPFRVKDIATEIGELFAIQAAEKGVKLAIIVDRDADLYVLGDPSRLRQIIVNLVGNAIKFTDYGKVEVKISLDGQEIAGSQRFKFVVSDTGIGIRKEFHDKIFQKFSQVESGNARRFGGSGLGLVISKHLVSLMDGTIGFQSEFGEGSTFFFTARFEVTSKKEIDVRRKRVISASEKVTWEHRPLTVLSVDDNIESLNVIKLFLKRLGHNAVPVSSGIDALRALETEPFDLVLMDIQMPGMDGLETTKRVRNLNTDYNQVPIIALTANAMSGDAERCFAAGMNDYLTKPIQMNALKDMLARWSQNFSPPDVANTKGQPLSE